MTTNTSYTSSDYNGFRPNPGTAASFRWNSPAPGPDSAAGPRTQLENRSFGALAEYSQATGQDRHSILVDYDIFEKVPRLDAQDISSLQKLYKAADLDFRLRQGSAAVDHGMVLPTITNGYAGAAPDLGALELGATMPRYGPRP